MLFLRIPYIAASVDSVKTVWNECREMLAGDPGTLTRHLEEGGWRRPGICLLVIVLGCGVYGATVGLWRDNLQAFYAALKFPMVILITCGANALLNGMLAQVLGTGLGFRQTTYAILMSFTIAAVILASFAPLTLFLLWNTPPMEQGSSTSGHSLTLLAHVAVIAFAGIVGNHRLLRLLRHVTGNSRLAAGMLCTWLGGNLLLGSQVSWIFRPFIGSPGLPVEFLRDEPLRGNFFEAVHRSFAFLFL